MRKWLQCVAHIPLLQLLFDVVVFLWGDRLFHQVSVSTITRKILARSNKVVCNIVGILFYGQGTLSDISTNVL